MNIVVKVAAAGVIAVLLYLMLGPAPAVEGSAPGIDKVAHLFAFATIAGCFALMFPARGPTVIGLITVILGGLVEVAQGQIGRDASLMDFAFDVIGAGVYWIAGTLSQRRKAKWKDREQRRPV